MNHYVYLLTDDAESNYIGVRSCKCLIQDDTKYWGSSKYIPDNVRETHNKIILGRFDTRVEAVEKEIFYHNLFDVARNPQFINRAKQTSTGFDTSGITRGPLPLITRKKLSDSRKGII